MSNGGEPWRSLITGEIGGGAPATKGGRIERLVKEEREGLEKKRRLGFGEGEIERKCSLL